LAVALDKQNKRMLEEIKKSKDSKQLRLEIECLQEKLEEEVLI